MQARASLFYVSLLVGCVDDPELGSSENEILGSFDFIDTTCTASQQAFFRDAGFVARTVVTSPAFEQCVRTRVPARYKRCAYADGGGDPNLTMAQHVANALLSTRSVNDLKMRCDPSLGAWGEASLGSTPGYYGDERFTFGQDSLDTAAAAPYPSGLREVAATIIHENMHQHGYTHNPGCTDTTIVDGLNTMPWIVDGCLMDVIDESMTRCGDICDGGDVASCKARGRLRLVTSLGATSCGDSFDPGIGGIGALQVRGGQLVALDMLPHGRPWGTWGSTNKTTDRLLADGDLDPTRAGDEMLFEYSNSFGDPSGWYAAGFDVRATTPERTTFAATRGYGYLDVLGAPAGTSRWYLYRDTTVLGVGRYSSASAWGTTTPRDELLVRGPDALGVIALSGTFRTRNRMPFGTVLTGPGGRTWTVGANDQLMAQADLDGDGRLEIVMRSSSRVGILSRTGSDGSFQVLDSREIVGSWWGFWALSSADRIVATGDFVGDAREEVLIRSGWGIAVLGMPVGSTSLRDLWGAEFGSVISGRWTLRTTDVALLPGRWASSTKKAVLLHGTDGLATLTWSLSGSSVVATIPSTQHTPATGASFSDPDTGGFWKFSTSDRLLAMGDFDGDGRDSLLIRSGWGNAIVGPSATSSRWFVHDAVETGCAASAEVACHDGLYGSWLSRETDTIVTTLTDNTGASSLILRSRP